MKNNKIMKAAAGMMALTLMTSCFVGGTFAKYVTQADGEDNARVAKFGVTLAINGDSSFSNKYEYDTTDDTVGQYAVKSSDDAKVVAPGTKSDENGMTFTIKGTPEVAVKVEAFIEEEGEDAFNDIYLKKTTENTFYRDWTDAGKAGKDEIGDENNAYGKTFGLEKDYYPVKFKLELIQDESENISENPVLLKEGNLKEINDFLNDKDTGYMKNAVYGPNEPLDATFRLTWEWKFEDEEKEYVDKADTLLGNLAAAQGETTTAEDDELDFTKSLWSNNKWESMTNKTNYSTDLSYKLTLRVTQVD